MWLIQQSTPPNVFAVLYYPPQINKKIEYEDHIITTVDTLITWYPNATFTICGDFNDFSPEHLLNNLPLSNVFTGPTYHSSQLDFILSSCPCVFEDVTTVPLTLITDHYAILANPQPNKTHSRYYKTFRDHRLVKQHLLNYQMDLECFQDVLTFEDPNEALAYLYGKINKLYNTCCPLRRVRVSTKDPPHITPQIKFLLKQKNEAHRKGKSSTVRRLSEEVRNLILQHTADKAKFKKGSREWWETVNEQRGVSKESAISKYPSNDINKHFVDISTISNYQPPELVTSKDAAPALSLGEVYNSLKKLKRTASGEDDIPWWVIKNNAHNLAEPLLHIYNRCISSGIFPSLFKVSKVIPLKKKKFISSMNDLRPIALTNVLSRHFERLIFDKFIRVDYNNYLSPNQFGFRQLSSTSHAVLRLLDTVKKLDDDSTDYVRLFALDLSKAFDRVPHHIISQRLSALPFPKQIINLVIDFLKDRSQYVQLEGNKSTLLPVNCGVPQGTVLGPILFNLVYDDLQVTNCGAYVNKFADDITCLIPGKHDQPDAAAAVITDIVNWCTVNNFLINTNKSVEICFRFKNIPVPLQVHDIPQQKETKILGIVVDEKLSFDTQIRNVNKQCMSLIYLLRKLRSNCLNGEEISFLYQSLVVPRLTYGLICWGSANESKLWKLDKIQERAKKMELIKNYKTVLALRDEQDKRFMLELDDRRSILHNILPIRSNYASSRLRSRHAGPDGSTKRKYRRFFPDRLYKVS